MTPEDCVIMMCFWVWFHIFLHAYQESCAIERDSIRGGDDFLSTCYRDQRYCRRSLRMQPRTVRLLCDMLRDRDLLHDAREVSVEEQVCMFLWTLGQRASNRNTQDVFNRSGQTISKYFNKVLTSICRLGKDYVTLLDEETPSKIATDPSFFPYFKDCLGAIGTSHFPAYVPSSEQFRYMNRKDASTQNVLGVVGFDLRFHYVYAGWEGSASDPTVLQSALDDKIHPFVIPQGKYYLAGKGYPLITGTLTPHLKQRNSLSEFNAEGADPIRTKEELFNCRHSSLYSTVERVFGTLKARFPILKTQFPYSYPTQVKIVLATCALHNFILAHEENVVHFEDVQSSRDRKYNVRQPNSILNGLLRAEHGSGKPLRDSLTNMLWENYLKDHEKI